MNNISLLLKEKNMTAYDLSKQIKTAESVIHYWLQNKTTPSATALIKLADFFNVSVDYLLGRTKNREPYRS